MIYLLYSTEKLLIDQELSKIFNTYNVNIENIIKYNLENTSINTVIEDAQTYSMFDDKKVIIVENSYIFSGKKGIEQNIDMLESYIKNYNPDTILIFTIVTEKLDERKKIVKEISKCGQVKNLINNDIKSFVKNNFNDYKINNSDIDLLIERVGNNLSILNNEITKIKTYKNNDKQITTNDIISLTTKSIDTDIFKFIDNIIDKNKSNALETYNELIKLGEEPIKIIVMLANQFRLMFQVKGLTKKGYSEKDIAKILNIHPYRVKLSLGKSKCFSDDRLLNILKQLAELDSNIKKGNIDKYLGLELFILNI